MQKTGIKYVAKLFSANALQIVFSQLGALFLFWLSSKELSKSDFGTFNWYFAIYGTIFAIASFGFDFIVIKRVSSKNDLNAARMQLVQSCLICFISVIPAILLVFSDLLNEDFSDSLFILVAFQFTYLAMPFKNALTGKELFSKSAQAVIISNLLKICLIIFLYFSERITLFNVSLAFALSNFTELLVYVINSYKIFDKTYFSGAFDFKSYKVLFRESLPQLGVIIFDSAFARIDWILLGALTTINAATVTAEYSFAYKIFEVSRLPLLILAPILFTRFSKLFHNSQITDPNVNAGVYSFFKLELVIGVTIPLLLNIVWVPLMQLFTGGKYGSENHQIYFLLSLTIPFMYMINFLWTLAFAQGQLKLTMILSVVNSCLNILLNILLIPRYGQTGAAVAFLTCNVIMLPLYLKFVKQERLKFPVKESVIVISIALLVSIVSYFLPIHPYLKSLVCILSYILIIYSLKILTFAEIKMLKHFIKKD